MCSCGDIGHKVWWQVILETLKKTFLNSQPPAWQINALNQGCTLGWGATSKSQRLSQGKGGNGSSINFWGSRQRAGTEEGERGSLTATAFPLAKPRILWSCCLSWSTQVSRGPRSWVVSRHRKPWTLIHHHRYLQLKLDPQSCSCPALLQGEAGCGARLTGDSSSGDGGDSSGRKVLDSSASSSGRGSPLEGAGTWRWNSPCPPPRPWLSLTASSYNGGGGGEQIWGSPCTQVRWGPLSCNFSLPSPLGFLAGPAAPAASSPWSESCCSTPPFTKSEICLWGSLLVF